ncbi:MAG: hypothetical protein ACXWKH_20220 [Limisphaerales bacterium]
MAMPIPVQLLPAAQGSAVSSITSTFSTNVTAGNSIIIGVSAWLNSSTNIVVSDSFGNIYTKDSGAYINTNPGTARRAEIFSFQNATGGATTVTAAAATGSGHYIDLFGFEVPTLLASLLDVASGNTGTGTSATPGAITTTNANDLLVVCCDFDFSSTQGITLPLGYAAVGLKLSGAEQGMAMIQPVNSIQTSINPAVTIGGSIPWACCIAAYKYSVAGGGGLMLPSGFDGGFHG